MDRLLRFGIVMSELAKVSSEPLYTAASDVWCSAPLLSGFLSLARPSTSKPLHYLLHFNLKTLWMLECPPDNFTLFNPLTPSVSVFDILPQNHHNFHLRKLDSFSLYVSEIACQFMGLLG